MRWAIIHLGILRCLIPRRRSWLPRLCGQTWLSYSIPGFTPSTCGRPVGFMICECGGLQSFWARNWFYGAFPRRIGISGQTKVVLSGEWLKGPLQVILFFSMIVVHCWVVRVQTAGRLLMLWGRL